MSGHSKWANIKRKKEAQDKQKGKIFGKMSRLITIAIIEGGGITNPDSNIRLRLAIDKAKQENMPKGNIERAIEKGTGPIKDWLKEVVYEAFGPHGSVFLILSTTDNGKRTLSEVRNTLERNTGKLGNYGSVSYQFRKCASIIFPIKDNKEDDILSFSEKISAFDIDEDESCYKVFFPYEQLGHVKTFTDNLIFEAPEIDYLPLTKIKLINHDEVQKVFNIIEALEELDDVHKVFTNIDFHE